MTFKQWKSFRFRDFPFLFAVQLIKFAFEQLKIILTYPITLNCLERAGYVYESFSFMGGISVKMVEQESVKHVRTVPLN